MKTPLKQRADIACVRARQLVSSTPEMAVQNLRSKQLIDKNRNCNHSQKVGSFTISDQQSVSFTARLMTLTQNRVHTAATFGTCICTREAPFRILAKLQAIMTEDFMQFSDVSRRTQKYQAHLEINQDVFPNSSTLFNFRVVDGEITFL
jgi:hypothetical protein